MVKAIDFAVRDSAGGLVRGAVAGENGSFVQMGAGDEISLNLARQSVAGFSQSGSDLIITLIDGREIVLAGYFNETGEPNQLYLSQNGEIAAVELTPAGDGTMVAAYGPTEGWDKFSTLDDLRFAQGDDVALAAATVVDEQAGMGMFVPGLVGLGGAGAGLAGLGLVGGLVGGGGGGGSTGPRPPAVNEADSSQTVMTESEDKTLDVSGTGEPGDTVIVHVGDETQTTVIGEDGTWEVTFPEDGLPADGTYETEVVFEHGDDSSTTLDGPTFVIDLTPPDVEVTEGAKSTGDIENAAEYANGVTISGEGEVGAAIVVQVGGHTQNTTVGSNGTWSVTFPTSQVAAGEYEIPFTVTATDAVGNDTVLHDILVVDTVPHPITFIGDGGQHRERRRGCGGLCHHRHLDRGGQPDRDRAGHQPDRDRRRQWRLDGDFAAGALPGGEYDATVTATTTDAAGNSSSHSHTFQVDTTTSVHLRRRRSPPMALSTRPRPRRAWS
ncbi:MAG: Ig-like domain-containing protein [Paracoccaceae bacterium]